MITGRSEEVDPDLLRGLAAARAAAGADPTEVAARAALALLTPGCFAAGQARAAVTALAADGFRPAYAQLVSFDADLVTRMWADSLPVMEPSRRQVVYDLLISGESMLLVLVDPAATPDSPASERLAAAKGHSDPARCSPRSLRVRLGAANRVINLLHTSTSTDDSIRELALVLGPDDLATAWRCAAAGREADLGGPLLDTGGRWYGNSLAHVCAAVRGRLVAALAAEAPAIAPWQQRCAQEWAWVATLPVRDPRAVALSYREAFPRPMLAVALDAPEPQSRTARARLRALAALDRLQYGGDFDVDDLRDTLAQARCVVESWEWVVLASFAVSPLPAAGVSPVQVGAR